MKRYAVVVAVLTAVDMAVRFASLGMYGSLTARVGSLWLALVHNLHSAGFPTPISPLDWLWAGGLVLIMLALSRYVRPSKPLRLPLALFVSGAVTNMTSLLLFGAVANPFGASWPGGWILFNLADVTVYLGFAWYIAVCIVLFGKELVNDKQHAAGSSHDGGRGLGGFRRQPRHS